MTVLLYIGPSLCSFNVPIKWLKGQKYITNVKLYDGSLLCGVNVPIKGLKYFAYSKLPFVMK